MPNAEYYQKNKEKCIKEATEWNRKNTERRREIRKKWKKANAWSAKEYKRQRRARKRKQIGNIPSDYLVLLDKMQSGLCFYCFNLLDLDYHLEHKTPVSRGGLHDFDNLCLSCPSCNHRKGSKTFEEFTSF